MTYLYITGYPIFSKAIRLLCCILLISWLMPGVAEPRESATKAFKTWFKKYKKGEIQLYQSSSVPLAQQDESSFKYYKKDNLHELDALLQALAEENNLNATKLLVDAASHQFHRIPDKEIEKYFEAQPWLLRIHAVEALQKIDDPESIKWLRQRCLDNNSGADAPLRKVIALALIGNNKALSDPSLLIDLLDNRDPRVRIKALEGLGRVGNADHLELALDAIDDKDPLVRVAAVETAGKIVEKAQSDQTDLASFFLSRLTPHLEDPEWQVQETILSMMERYRCKDSIPVLLDFLEKVSLKPGEYRERIIQSVVSVLRSLTGAPIQEKDPQKWNQWWAEHHKSFRLTPTPSRALRGLQLTGPSFFNIPVHSNYVIFILDISGSMRAPLPSQFDAEEEKSVSKLDRARKELAKTLNALTPDVYFNIILFNETVVKFAPEPVRATGEIKRKAELFFQEAHADEGTNIFDSLNEALKIKSMGLINRIDEDIQLDTIFLLSDGVPTTGIIIDPAEILRIITQANRLARIKINTIYLGAEPSLFMRTLAEKNLGRFVHIR